ncbi:acyl-CoA dehydrogenase family protein [Paraconexibacter antarcticus]|uniref:Acyl-CoA dehydrogenase family protein n=1 Tax=Paraconexibacter antarcticus TaxID=2949664 RepID=A0ABY5DVY2_9ACTN|nr:acyl-CoA dehydrogenase family protein [Paraconexibacter antarcticus]UTI65689.1 acyl-CoA dehydrogenase family protein [Paraconexibacter antarcticus]
MTPVAAPPPPTASNRATGNTPPRLEGFDVVGSDAALVDALQAFGAGDRLAECSALGRELGSREGLEAGFLANEQPPVHRPYDRGGARTDEVTFTPAWDHVMRLAVEHGVAGAVWADEHPAAQVARAAKFIAVAQVEAGSTCPLAMTYACVPALRLTDAVAARWERPVTSGVYDTRALPAGEKAGALIGMALTEKQGGSDVRTNTTVAEPEPDAGDGWYRVTGEKWFVSAVHSDAMFVLAQTAEGVSCLLVPRRLDDGGPNGWTIDRLKDKLGNRSNPTAEVRFDGSLAQLVGEPGRGVRAIMAMIGGTRQDCVLGSTAVMRTGTVEAIHWARHRTAFGRPLADQPAMTAVLADLAVESEAATWSALRLARATQDAAAGDAQAIAFRRLAGPVLKFWVCKRAPMHAAEALECQGGYGYVEESRLPRSYREAPLMSVWEGSGNVQALDVLRAMQREPESVQAFRDEVAAGAGADRRLDAAIAGLEDRIRDVPGEAGARALTGWLARCLQASLLVRHAPPAVADAYCATRLTGDGDGTFGCLPRGADATGLVARGGVRS